MAEWRYSTTVTYADWEFMDNNCLVIWEYLSQYGWTKSAVAALCGNLKVESGINPWSVGTGGGGLAGWTPLSNLQTFADRHGLDYSKGETQIYLISLGWACGAGATGRPEDGLQWQSSIDPHSPNPGGSPVITWEEFKTNETIPADVLATYYMYYWEKPDFDPVTNQTQNRKDAANHFLEVLGEAPIYGNRRRLAAARDVLRRLVIQI